MKRVILRNVLFIIGSLFLLAFFLEKSRAIYFSDSQRYTQILSQLKEEEALLDQEIIKSRYEFSISYDPLVKHLTALKKHHLSLKNIPPYVDREGKQAIKLFLKESADVIRQKENAIEGFKSLNSILKNSQHYLPVLIEEIHEYEASLHKRVYHKLSELLDNVLLYNYVSHDKMKGDLEAKIDEVSNLRSKYITREDRELVKLAVAHVKLIIRIKPQLDIVTKKILELSIRDKEQKIEKVYNLSYERANERVNQYQLYGSVILITIVIIGFSFALKKLAKSRQAALEASNIKAKFLANMSHEIRTPMNGILGMTFLLSETELDEEQREYVQSIEFSGKNLLSIINNILDFSKLEAGEMHLENINFNLKDCLDNVVNYLSAQARDKNLEIIAWIDKEVPQQLQGDFGRLRQVLINLTSNAIKFTDSGEILLQVSVVKQPSKTFDRDRGLWLNFSVMDTGIGIASKDRGKLFKSFSQIDASTTRKYGGTGLGLVICKQLVQLMGGKIGLKSKVGVGSTFWFIVPFKTVQIPAKIEKEEPNLGGRKLLILGRDNPRSKLLQYTASKCQLQVDLIDDPREASAALTQAINQNRPYELVLLDLGTYRQMLLELQSSGTRSATKFILLISPAQKAEAEKMLSDEIVDYIVSPIAESEAIESMQKAIDALATRFNSSDTAKVSSS